MGGQGGGFKQTPEPPLDPPLLKVCKLWIIVSVPQGPVQSLQHAILEVVL